MELEDMTTEKLMEEYNKEWNFLTKGKDSSDDEVQALGRILSIDRELTRRSDR